MYNHSRKETQMSENMSNAALEARRAYQREYYKKNKKTIQEYHRNYYKKNKRELAEKRREFWERKAKELETEMRLD